MVLDDIRIILDLDAAKNDLLNLYIRKADTLIKNYLQTSDDVETSYPDAIIEYVTIQYNKRGNEGLKQFTQGNINGTYVDDIPQSVKALLPLPSAKLMG